MINKKIHIAEAPVRSKYHARTHVLLQIESKAYLSVQQAIAWKSMSLGDLTLDLLGLVFSFLDHDAQNAWCNCYHRVAFCKHQRLLRLKQVQLHACDSVLDGNAVYDAFWVAANLTTRPSNIRCGSVSIEIDPVKPMSGKIDLCIKTGLENDFFKCMEYIPNGIVDKFTLYLYHGDSNNRFLDCDFLPEEIFLHGIGAFCTKMDVQKLEMHYMANACACALQTILAFKLPRLKTLCLTNFDGRDDSVQDIARWFADKPLEKLDLRRVQMNHTSWDQIEAISTLTHFDVWNCNQNAEEMLQMNFKKPLERFAMRGPIADFRYKSVSIAWAEFCKRNSGLKHLTISVKANLNENFQLFLTPLELLNVQQLDMRFNLDRSHFAFFKLSQTLVNMPNLLEVSLRQTEGAESIAKHQAIQPSVKYPPLGVTPEKARRLVSWVQGLTKLEIDNLALHNETQSLVLDTVCENPALEVLSLHNFSKSRTLPAEHAGRLRIFRHANTCGQVIKFMLPSGASMSKLTELELVGVCNLHDQDAFKKIGCDKTVEHLVYDFKTCIESTTEIYALVGLLFGIFDLPILKSLEIRNVEVPEFAKSMVESLKNVNSEDFCFKELRSFTFYLSYSSYETLKRLICEYVKLMPNLQTLRICNVMYERCVYDFIDILQSCECLEHLHFSFHGYTDLCIGHRKFAFQKTSYPQLKCISFDETKRRPKTFYSYVKHFGKMFAKEYANILVTSEMHTVC